MKWNVVQVEKILNSIYTFFANHEDQNCSLVFKLKVYNIKLKS